MVGGVRPRLHRQKQSIVIVSDTRRNKSAPSEKQSFGQNLSWIVDGITVLMEQRVCQCGGGSEFIDGVGPIRMIPRPAHQRRQYTIAQFSFTRHLPEMLHVMKTVRQIFRVRITFAFFHRLLTRQLRQTTASVTIDGISGKTAMSAIGQIVPQCAMRQHLRHNPRRDELPIRLREQIASAKLPQAFRELDSRADAVCQIAWAFVAASIEIEPKRQIIAQMTAKLNQHGGLWKSRFTFHCK